MEYKQWMKYVTPEDIPNDDLKDFVELIGIDSVLKLILYYSGTHISIPAYICKKAKEKYIIEEFDGTTHKSNKLAIECGISQRQVYNIVENHLSKKLKQKNETENKSDDSNKNDDTL